MPVVADSSVATGSPQRTLVLCLGGIGDTVLSFAALRDLRAVRPNDPLTALAMWPQSAELLEDLGIFDEVLCHNFQRAPIWKSLAAALRLRSRRFDASVLAFPANRFEYNGLSRLLGAKRRWGHSYLRGGDLANLRMLLTDKIDQVEGRHTVDENRALIAAFTGQTQAGSAEIRLGPLAPHYHDEAGRMLSHLQSPLLGIHAGSSSYKGLATKRWPVERFGELCREAHRALGLQPVVFGMPEEWKLKTHIQSQCPEVFFAHGDTIRHTAALIARCAAFVSNDSALAHVASALDVPVIMICGPTDWNEVRPFAADGIALSSATPCSPCFRVGRQPMRCTHAVHQACLKSVSVARVLAAVEQRVRWPERSRSREIARQRDVSLAVIA